jgi:hypothetical protein
VKRHVADSVHCLSVGYGVNAPVIYRQKFSNFLRRRPLKYRPGINYGQLVDPCDQGMGLWMLAQPWLGGKNWFTLGPVFTLFTVFHESILQISFVYFSEMIFQFFQTLIGIPDEVWHSLTWFQQKY